MYGAHYNVPMIIALQASSSKTPYPALGLSTLAPSPHQYRTHSCNMSPHPSATDAPAGSVDQPQHESSQQHTLPSAAASGLAAGAHQLEAQWEADSLTAAQTASRLSLLQAEHTQVELELATAAQHADAKAGDAGLSHDQRQEAVVATAAAAAEAACDNPHESFPFVPVQQHQHATVSSNKTQSQRAETASQATQSQSVKPTQSNRTGSRRMTRSSARASLASQNSESHAVSTAQGGRRCQTQAGLSLPVVMERSEADLAADSAVSTAEMDDDHQTLVSHAAAEAAADRDAEPSGNQHLLAIDTALASVPEEADGSAPPASPTLPQGDTQQIMVLGRDDLHDCDAHIASASGYAAAEAAASAPSQEAARQTRHIQSAQHSGRVDGCDAVQASASDNATVSAANGVEANEQISGRPDSAAEGSSPAAQSKQGQKGKDRAKQPPKCRQAVRKRQNRKQGRTASARDENADVNTVSTSQHLSVHSSDTSAAKQHTSGGAALDYSASSPVQKGCQEIGASDQMGLADKVEGSSKPPR